MWQRCDDRHVTDSPQSDRLRFAAGPCQLVPEGSESAARPAASRQPALVGAQFHRINVIACIDPLERSAIGSPPYPDGGVVPAGEKRSPIVAEIETDDGLLVPVERANRFTSACIPDPCSLVEAGARKLLAAGAEPHVPDIAPMAFQHERWGTA